MSAHLETAPLATKPRTSWLQNVKFFALAGTGFFSDGYLNITMGLGALGWSPLKTMLTVL